MSGMRTRKTRRNILPSLLSVGGSSDRPQLDSRICLYSQKQFQDNYPVWFTLERLMRFIYSLPKSAAWNFYFSMYIIVLVTLNACIDFNEKLNPKPGDLALCGYITFQALPYIFHVTALICSDCYSFRLGESRHLYPCGYVLDAISLTVPYVTAIFVGISIQTKLINLAAIALRMHRPLQYLGSLDYNLTGSVTVTLYKYLYISFTIRILYAFIYMSSGYINDNIAIQSINWLNATARSRLFHAFYLTNKVFIPLGADLPPLNDESRIMFIVAMMTGVLLTLGIAVASLSLIISLYMRPEEEFRSRFRLIMSDMNSTNLPPKLCKKVQTFYQMFWHKQKAVSETRLLPEYPPCLLIAIRTNIYFQAMQKSRIVKDLSSSFLSEIAKHMKTIYYIPGDFIIERNSSKSSMIFINYGEVELLSAEDDETALLRFLCGTILNPCGVCIEMACTRSYVAISAATFCIAHVLEASKLWHVAKKYGVDVQNFIMQSAFTSHLEKVKRHYKKRKPAPPVLAKYKSNIVLLKHALMELKEARDENGKLLLERADMFLNISGCYMMRNQTDMSLTEEADEICLRLTFPYILQPDSSLLNAWNSFVALLTLIVVFVYPYYLIFINDVPNGFRFFNHIVTIVYILDVIVHMSTGAKVEEGVPLTFTRTASEQMKSAWFVIHLISILPIFEIVGDGFYSGINKLVKTPQIFRKLKNLEDACVYHSNILRLFSFFLLCIILTYLVGAAQQVYGCAFGYCLVTNFTDSPHWEKKPLDDSPVASRLLYSLYFAISIITFTSHKTASLAKLLWEHQLFVIFLMEICIIFHILIEGTYSATIMVTESLWDRYTTCIETVKKFLVNKNVDVILRHRFISYLQLCWYSDKAYAITHEKQSILFDLPPHVHEDILTMQRSKYILRIPFMKFPPNHVVKKISAQARQFHTAPNEILQNTGDISNEIYVIREGTCEVLDPVTKKVVRLLSAKNHFGDVECLLRLPAYYSVRAATHIRLFSISRKHLQKCIEVPKIKDAINYTKELPEYASSLVARKSFIKFQMPEITPNRELFPLPRKHIPDSAFTGPFRKFGHLSVLRYVFPRFTLRPDGKYLKRYEWFRAVCALASANIFPVYTYLVLQFPFLYYLTLLLDLTAYFDVFQRMFIGYFDQRGILISHPSSTFIHYIKGSFLVDLISCLQLEYLDYVRTTIYTKDGAFRQPGAIQILMYNRILQLYRVSHTLDMLSDYIDRLDIILMIKALPVFLALLTVVTSLMLEMSIEKWAPLHGGWWRLEILRDPIHGSWIEKNGNEVWYNITETPFNAVLTTFYWVTYETTSTGFNVIQPGRLEMIGILTAGMLLGTVITVYYAVRVISIRANVNRALGKFQEHMKDIITFMRREKFDPNFQRLVVSHYEYQWDKMGGTDYRSILKLCDQITLRTDAILHIYGDTFTKCPILRNDISLLRCVGRAIFSTYLRKHMTIMERNDVISEMYIIDHGFVEMHGQQGHITYLSRGSVFGNLDDFKTVVCPVKFMTSSNVHLLQINADKFCKIIEDFPTVKDLVVENRKRNKYCIQADNLLPKPIRLGMSQVEFANSLGLKRKILKFILKHKKYSQISSIVISVLCVYGDLYNAGFQSNAKLLITLLYILDICFYLLVLLKISLPLLAVKDSETYNEQLIFKQAYKETIFKYDVVSSLPIEVFSFCSKTPMNIFPILRLNRCFRLVSVHDSLAQYHKNLTINLTITTMASVLLWFTVFVHTAACMWHYLGVMMDDNIPFSSWRHYDKGRNTTLCGNRYICSVYFIITTFTLSGIGDILPRQQAEVVFVCILMILSTLILMIYVGEFSNIIQYRSFRYYSFYSKYLELLAFLKNNRVSQNLIKVTKNYTLHLWQEARGQQVPYFLKTAPQSLRLDIMSTAFMHHLKKHPVFCDCEPSFLRQLVGHFRFYHYSEELRVVKEGEITNSMYFVHKGRVQEVEEDTEQKNDFFIAGQAFGTEHGLVRDVPYKFTYTSVIKSQVLTLCLDEWEYLLQHFPASKNIIYFDKQDMFRHSSTSIESLKPQPKHYVDTGSVPKFKHISFSRMQSLQLNRKSESAAGDQWKSQSSIGKPESSSAKKTSHISTKSQEMEMSSWPMETKRSTAAGSTVPGEIENTSPIFKTEKSTELTLSESPKSQTKLVADTLSTNRQKIPTEGKFASLTNLTPIKEEDQVTSQWPLDSRKSSPITQSGIEKSNDIKQTQGLSRPPYSGIVIKDTPNASTVDVKTILEPKEEIVAATLEKIPTEAKITSSEDLPPTNKEDNAQSNAGKVFLITQSGIEKNKQTQGLSRPPYSSIVIKDTPNASTVDIKTILEPKQEKVAATLEKTPMEVTKTSLINLPPTNKEDQIVSQWPLDSRKSSPLQSNMEKKSVITQSGIEKSGDIKQTQGLSRPPYSGIVIKDTPNASTDDVKTVIEPNKEIRTTTLEKTPMEVAKTSLTNLPPTNTEDQIISQWPLDSRKSSPPQSNTEKKSHITQSRIEKSDDVKQTQELSRPPYSGIVIKDTPNASTDDIKTSLEPKKEIRTLEKTKSSLINLPPTNKEDQIISQWPLDSRKSSPLQSSMEKKSLITQSRIEKSDDIKQTQELSRPPYSGIVIKDTPNASTDDIKTILDPKKEIHTTTLEKTKSSLTNLPPTNKEDQVLSQWPLDSRKSSNLQSKKGKIENSEEIKEPQELSHSPYSDIVIKDTPIEPKEELGAETSTQEDAKNEILENKSVGPITMLVDSHELAESLTATTEEQSSWSVHIRKYSKETKQTESQLNVGPKDNAEQSESSQRNKPKSNFLQHPEQDKYILTSSNTDLKQIETEIIEMEEIQPRVVKQDDSPTEKDTKLVEVQPLPVESPWPLNSRWSSLPETNVVDKNIETEQEDDTNISKITSSELTLVASNISKTSSKRTIYYDPDTQPLEHPGNLRARLDSEGSILTITHYKERSMSFEEYLVEKNSEDKTSDQKMTSRRRLSIVSADEPDQREQTSDPEVKASSSKKKSLPGNKSSSEEKQKKEK